jgi:hypothetical protein
MPPAVSMPLLLAVFALALLGMRRGWLHRTTRSAAALSALPDPDADLGAALTPAFPVSYVSTTRAGDWLDRVTVYELGNRCQATAQVCTDGIRIVRSHGAPLVLTRSALHSVDGSSGMAGKFVGRDALVVLRWSDGDRAVAFDTGILPRYRADREILVDAVQGLLSGPRPTKGSGA